MAITINGSGTITGVSAGGLPDGCVDNDTIANSTIANAKLVNDSVTVNGTSIDLGASDTITAGKVLQVVQASKIDTASYASTSWAAISGLSASITPSSTSNKIMVSINLNVGQNNGTTTVLRIYRGTTAIGLGESAGSRLQVSARVSPSNIHWTFPLHQDYLDSPSTTSQITYYVYWKNQANTLYINRNSTNSDDTSHDQSRAPSNITLTEIAG